MILTGPANDAYLELIGATAFGQIESLVGFANVRTMEVALDIAVMAVDDFPVGDASLFGQESFWWFLFDQTSKSTIENVRFATTRNTTNEAAFDGELVLGRRYSLFGRDDGESVIIRINGSDEDVTDATSLGTLDPIDIDSELPRLGNDFVYTTSLRLYEAQVKVNDQVVFHVRPKATDSGTTVRDLSRFGNDMILMRETGTLVDADYLRASAWNSDPAYAGRDTL